MRGKRAKQYRKLMHQYALSFNFREPYQVLIDAAMIQDTVRFKMDLPHLLERTLHGKIKPMITECSIRHLYNSTHQNREEKSAWIHMAKGFEKRRCGHHEEEEPLGTGQCLLDVVDPKSSGTNKNRYIVACQDSELRARMRMITGVPLVYVQRSVMIMEPMAARSEEVRDGIEADKIRAGIRGGRGDQTTYSLKRTREDDGEGGETTAEQAKPAKKKPKGPKGPNPLSMMKKKKRVTLQQFGQPSPGNMHVIGAAGP